MISLFSAEFEKPKIDISGKRLSNCISVVFSLKCIYICIVKSALKAQESLS